MDEHIQQFFTYLEDGKPTVFVFQEMVKGRSRELKQLLKMTDEMKHKLIEKNLAVYPSISRAARALSKMIGYYENKHRFNDRRSNTLDMKITIILGTSCFRHEP